MKQMGYTPNLFLFFLKILLINIVLLSYKNKRGKMEINNINNEINFKNGVLEIEIGPDGEFSEETRKFILERVQEAIDENIWYTQEEVIETLNKL